MTPKKQSRKTIPDFANRKEMAQWFDTHDVGDYLDEFDVVDSGVVTVAKHLSEVVTVRLNRQTLSDLRRQARQQGIGISSLARMWILERIRESKKAAASS